MNDPPNWNMYLNAMKRARERDWQHMPNEILFRLLANIRYGGIDPKYKARGKNEVKAL